MTIKKTRGISLESRAYADDGTRFAVIAFFCLSCALVLGGIVLLQSKPSFARHASGDASAGRDIFRESCQHCHGPNGRGDGQMAEYLTPPPADLSSSATQARTDDELRKVIIEGRKGTAMDGFDGAFEDPQLIDLVAFIRSLRS